MSMILTLPTAVTRMDVRERVIWAEAKPRHIQLSPSMYSCGLVFKVLFSTNGREFLPFNYSFTKLMTNNDIFSRVKEFFLINSKYAVLAVIFVSQFESLFK